MPAKANPDCRKYTYHRSVSPFGLFKVFILFILVKSAVLCGIELVFFHGIQQGCHFRSGVDTPRTGACHGSKMILSFGQCQNSRAYNPSDCHKCFQKLSANHSVLIFEKFQITFLKTYRINCNYKIKTKNS